MRKLANTETNLSRLDDLLGEIHRQLGPLGRQARISRRADAIQISVRDAQARLYAEDAQRSMNRRDTVRQELGDLRNQLAVAQHELAQAKVRIEQVEALSSESSPTIAKANQYWHEFSQTRERLNALAQLAEERSRSLTGQIVTNTQQMEPMPVIAGLAKYPEDLVDKMRAKGIKVDAMDCLALADQAGYSKAVNMVLMGRLSHYFPNIPAEAWQASLEANVPAKVLELNKVAFALGQKG